MITYVLRGLKGLGIPQPVENEQGKWQELVQATVGVDGDSAGIYDKELTVVDENGVALPFVFNGTDSFNDMLTAARNHAQSFVDRLNAQQ